MNSAPHSPPALVLDVRTYLLMGGALWAVWILSMGPGLYTDTDPGSTHWSYQLFKRICHAIPSRTYHLDGISMAVNSRCFGVFSGFVIAWLSIPKLGRRIYRRKWVLYFFAASMAVQFVDVFGNGMGLWTNTLLSRWVLGMGLGSGMVLIISDLFFKSNRANSNSMEVSTESQPTRKKEKQ